MRLFFIITLAAFVGGCSTNRIHFSPYTEGKDISRIERTRVDVDVRKVSGATACVECKESDRMVWHAANNSAFLYEGFFSLPVDDWDEFVRTALEANPSAEFKVELEIGRIFLKTWQNPSYYACDAEVHVIFNGNRYSGSYLVKIPGAGQDLLGMDRVRLKSYALRVVQLSLKAAYIDALEKTQ